jgi:Fur family ferric uptake transcriptional regulator
MEIDIKDKLKEKGYKFTTQRRAVLDVVNEKIGQHLSSEEIYNFVKEKYPEIGLATVYRTLQMLEEVGVINRLNFDDGCNRYELAHPENQHSHHHLICTNCEKVIEVQEDLLEELEKQIAEKNNFLIEDHNLKFFGLCSECRKLQNK